MTTFKKKIIVFNTRSKFFSTPEAQNHYISLLYFERNKYLFMLKIHCFYTPRKKVINLIKYAQLIIIFIIEILKYLN